MKKTVIIAAAGRGCRLGAELPKCLVEVAGHCIFEYQMKTFSWADEIRMIVGYKSDEVIKKVKRVRPDTVFIENADYKTTTTLQSNYLGCKGLKGQALFCDGDMIFSKPMSEKLLDACESGEEFIGVSTELSEEPVYANITEGKIDWFDYHRKTGFEWANIALTDVRNIEYKPTHFFVQLEKILPLNALEVGRLEIDTVSDLKYANCMIKQHPEKYDFWG